MTSPELRTDLWTGRQVIVAAARADRPQTVGSTVPIKSPQSQDAQEAKADPFLEGREVNTPSERLALRRGETSTDQTGWLLRIVANRYPAVAWPPSPIQNAATGIHDVVIECPNFRRCWLQFSTEEVARVLTAWQLRQQQLIQFSDLNSIQIFRNQGAAAGASLGHSHSQVIALTTVPALTEQRLQNSEGFDRWRQSEILDKTRMIVAQDLLAICPSASWVAGQIRICPSVKASVLSAPFHKLPAAAVLNLAGVLRKSIAAVNALFCNVSFNVVLNQPPIKSIEAFPWSIDIMPRTASFAGFELACDIPIITTSPESAATAYRKAWSSLTNEGLLDESPEGEICPPGFSWHTP